MVCCFQFGVRMSNVLGTQGERDMWMFCCVGGKGGSGVVLVLNRFDGREAVWRVVGRGN